jgi:hypothetical protein
MENESERTLENEIEETELPQFLPSWWQRNASELSNFFGSLVGLAVYGFAILLVIYFTRQDSTVIENFWFFFALIASVTVFSFVFMNVFEWKKQQYETALEEYNASAIDYILSNESIQTLRFALVPRDITNALTKILNDKAKKKALSPETVEISYAEKWFDELIKILGPVRVTENRNTILKYTQRGTCLSYRHPN